MTTFDGANYYFSGQGVVLIGQKDPTTGDPIGLRPVGNVPDLKINVATTVVEHKGSQDGQRATDKRLQTETKVSLSFVIENWSAKNLAKATRGSRTTIAGGTTTDTVKCIQGMVAGLSHIKVSAVTVKQGVTPLVAYVNDATDWDYKLNAEAGSIFINPGTNVDAFVPEADPENDPATLTVAYTYAAQERVDALTDPLTENWMRFEGLNTVEENEPVVVDIFAFSNDPLKELAMLSDTFGQFTIDGSVLKDDTRTTGSKYFSIKKLTDLPDLIS